MKLARKLTSGKLFAWLQEAIKSFFGGAFALLLPLIMIGGIYIGWFSPTESAAVALVYALFIEFFVHREENAKDAPAGAGFGGKMLHYFGTRQMRPKHLIEVILETTKLLATLTTPLVQDTVTLGCSVALLSEAVLPSAL